MCVLKVSDIRNHQARSVADQFMNLPGEVRLISVAGRQRGVREHLARFGGRNRISHAYDASIRSRCQTKVIRKHSFELAARPCDAGGGKV